MTRIFSSPKRKEQKKWSGKLQKMKAGLKQIEKIKVGKKEKFRQNCILASRQMQDAEEIFLRGQ